jgi:hypothetical protein
MIYRNWSLLSSTVFICGSVATAGLAGIFLFGGKVTNPPSAIAPSRRFPASVARPALALLAVSHVRSIQIWLDLDASLVGPLPYVRRYK